jgi:hypothetical protein
MGLMDKVKAQATQLAEKAQEAGKVGQAKIGNLQTKKQADTLLRELGAHHFARAKGRGDGQTDTKIAGVMAQLDAHEAEHGQIDLTPDPVVQGTNDAAGGMAPPVSSVVEGGSTVITSAPANVGGVPAGNMGVPSGAVGGVPSGNIGGLPSGNVGGLPDGAVGGIPSGNVGGVPEGAVGGVPSGNVGGVPQGAVGETPEA